MRFLTVEDESEQASPPESGQGRVTAIDASTFHIELQVRGRPTVILYRRLP